ncbi:MAG TPA: beta-N-acetylhexosaminidase, partial [Ohtaekwangia sp.]
MHQSEIQKPVFIISRFSWLFLLLLMSCNTATETHAQTINLIPQPVSLETGRGNYSITSSTTIGVPAKQPAVTKVAEYLVSMLQPATGLNIKITEGNGNGIQLTLNNTPDPRLGHEGYHLEVKDKGVVIEANDPAGLFYGVQTLLQLLPGTIESKSTVNNVTWSIPAVSITDYPRFAWRGVMLDVSRHFFPKEYVKQYINQLARYKFNRFHWHLTDDQGWRIEIKSLPKLTEVGAWRVPRVGRWGRQEPPKPGETATDGGFYTQEDITEIVKYARDRNIEIIPEIDVPGHSMAALAAYPELCVTKDTSIRVNPGSKFSTWFGNGKFEMHIDNTLNPTDEKVYQFLDKVFTEVAELFPFEFIHMGGDECYKGFWERDARVQAFMKKNAIKDGVALQAYFGKRVAQIIQSKKKKVIGWDEILEGGAPSGATVMSWQGTKPGIEATHLKHPVVMSPLPEYYLDMNQGELSIEPPIYNTARLKEVYHFDVLPPGIDSTLVLGAQGNLWTEQIPTTSQIEYMTYPRAFAVAESVWSPEAGKNWNNFITRVENHFIRLEAGHINYAPSMYDPIIRIKKNDKNKMVITITQEVPDVEARFTIDNTVPNAYSSMYKEDVVFPDGAELFRVQSYRQGKPVGRLITFTREELAKKV